VAWYKIGTVTLNSANASEDFFGVTYTGNKQVRGTSTSWTLSVLSVGEGILLPDGKVYEIAGINESTQRVYLAKAYGGANFSAATYDILPMQGFLKDLANRASDLISTYATIVDGPGAGKFPSGTLASPGIKFTIDEDTGLHNSGVNTLELVAGGVSKATISSAGVTISNNTTGSKKATFVVPDAQTVSTTRTITLPAVNGTLATIEGTETLLNKTLTSPVSTGGTFTNAALVTPSLGVATATSINGTTIPTSKTLVNTVDAQTITTKTINLASNTLVTTSAQLATAVTDETGSGLLVFNSSPALTGTVADTTTNLVNSADIGTAPNQIPINQYLGELAFMSKDQLSIRPAASTAPAGIGEMVFQLTSNTSLVIKVMGSDGVIRSNTLTLA